jgi:large subunit ribosomal protein L25
MPKEAEKIELKAEKRAAFGRKIKKLRQVGILPANIYGKKVESQAIQVNLKEFFPIFEEAGETGVVELKVKGEAKPRPVLIHNVQLHPVTDQPLHVDFYQVDLKEKVVAEVPLEIVGEAPAVKEKLGILIQLLAEVEVEALPTELPDRLEVDISGLEKVDDAIMAADLKVPKGVELHLDAKELLAKIEPPTKEEVAAPPPPAEGEVSAEGTVEGEVPPVSPTPEEGKKPSPEETSGKESPKKPPEPKEKREGAKNG